MRKSVQIDLDLYTAIYDYFLGGEKDNEQYIIVGLKRKQDKLNQHALYSISKNPKLSEEARETARKMYLDEKGVPEKFRY